MNRQFIWKTSVAGLGIICAFLLIVMSGLHSQKGPSFYLENRKNNLRKISYWALEFDNGKLLPPPAIEEIRKRAPDLEATLEPVAPNVDARLSLYESGNGQDDLVHEGAAFPRSIEKLYFSYYNRESKEIRFGEMNSPRR